MCDLGVCLISERIPPAPAHLGIPVQMGGYVNKHLFLSLSLAPFPCLSLARSLLLIHTHIQMKSPRK